MADGPESALQKGLIAALKADAGVASQVGARVHDTPPQRVTFPYVRLGKFDGAPWDTDATVGDELIFTIEAHCRPDRRGTVHARRLKEAIKGVLHRGEERVSVTGFVLVELIFLTSTTEELSDGKSQVARLAFRARLDV